MQVDLEENREVPRLTSIVFLRLNILRPRIFSSPGCKEQERKIAEKPKLIIPPNARRRFSPRTSKRHGKFEWELSKRFQKLDGGWCLRRHLSGKRMARFLRQPHHCLLPVDPLSNSEERCRGGTQTKNLRFRVTHISSKIDTAMSFDGNKS